MQPLAEAGGCIGLTPRRPELDDVTTCNSKDLQKQLKSGGAESGAFSAELLEISRAWIRLECSTRRKILHLVRESVRVDNSKQELSKHDNNKGACTRPERVF